MPKKNRHRREEQHQPPKRTIEMRSQPPLPQSQSNPDILSSGSAKASRLTSWGQVLAPLATILTLLFAAFQAWQSYQKEQMALLTLNTAERATNMALQTGELAKQAKADLVVIKDKQRELDSLTQISYLSIRAENGERAALAELFSIVPDKTNSPFILGPVSIARKNLDRITHKFDTMTLEDAAFGQQLSSITSMNLKPDSITADLHHTNFFKRAQAAFNVSFLRVNRLIPELYESAITEPDLHVLSVMCYSLNQLLDRGNSTFYASQFVFYPEWPSNSFNRLWFPVKDSLLAQSPKRWINVAPTNGILWTTTMLIDPDTQDEISGQPKKR